MNLKQLYQLGEEIAIHIPSLNKWQRDNLAMFSLGVVQAESCIQNKVAKRLRKLGKRSTVERRFQRFVSNERLPLERAQVEWSRWVLKALVSEEIILLVDETHLGEQVSAMVVGVAYEGRCIPLAWRCYPRYQYPEGSQVQLITKLLKQVEMGIPAGVRPLLQADRGIGTSPALIKEVKALGWRYLFRVQGQCKVREDRGKEGALSSIIQQGEYRAASGKVFKKQGWLTTHIRVLWAENQPEPWALVTNDPALTGWEYAQRNWQEQSFRDLKSGGWQWNRSHIWLPAHTERLLLVLSLAYAWVLSLGSYFIQAGLATPLRTRANGSQRRRLSVFREGLEHLDYMFRHNHFACPALLFVPDERLGP